MWIALIILLLCLLVGIDFYYGHKRMVSLEERPEYARGHVTSILSTGSHFFDSLTEDMKNATERIHMQFYIFRDDELGQKLIHLLKVKAQQGLDVRLLLDRLGSKGFSNETVNELKSAGVQVTFSRKPEFPFFLYRINHRNHRKLTIIDGTIGYIGGYNVGNEYLGQDTKLGDWRDYHLRLEGPVVTLFEKSFAKDWNLGTDEKKMEIPPVQPETKTYPTEFQIVSSSGQLSYQFFYEKIQRSKKSIFIGSPYFLPGKKMNNALIRAIKRGVNVTLLLPMKPDHPLVQEASYRFVSPLLEAGANIYMFHEGFYHSKAMIFDEQICDIGTANFDFRSFFFNDEINCIFTDATLIQEVKKVIESDLARSEKLTLERFQKSRTLWVRCKEGIGYLIGLFL